MHGPSLDVHKHGVRLDVRDGPVDSIFSRLDVHGSRLHPLSLVGLLCFSDQWMVIIRIPLVWDLDASVPHPFSVLQPRGLVFFLERGPVQFLPCLSPTTLCFVSPLILPSIHEDFGCLT